jgi:hypothetical protein
MSNGSEKLAEKSITETPWWATAPIWLAAGIVGVPSLIAIGAGYFLAHNVMGTINHNQTMVNRAVDTLNDIKVMMVQQHGEDLREWDRVKVFMTERLRIEMRTCIHEATNEKERDDCVKSAHEESDKLQLIR